MIEYAQAFLHISAIALCSVTAYRFGKCNGFDCGLKYLRKVSFQRSMEGHKHFCNVSLASVVCFEEDGDLWVKEYKGIDEPEGRTYLVFHCPWCGYQTEKSKLRESIEPKGIK